MTDYEKNKVRDLINGMSFEEIEIAKETIAHRMESEQIEGKRIFTADK